MTHLTMAIRTWNETIIRTGGERGDHTAPHREGIVTATEQIGVTDVEADGAQPAQQHRGPRPARRDLVGSGDGPHDAAEDGGQLGDQEGRVQQQGEGLVDAVAVQPELADEAVDGVVAGRTSDQGDAEHADGDDDDDGPPGRG